MKRKTIIFVTDLPLWSMDNGVGGKALYNTITYYLNDNKYDVYLITNQNNDYSNIHIDKEKVYYFKENRIIEYRNIRLFGFLARVIYSLSFYQKSKKLLNKLLNKIDGKILLYAYEVHAVSACKKMSMKYNLPLVTRFQGTIMSGYKNDFISRFRNYPHASALSTKSDLVIMTNDGTKGDYILKQYNNMSKTLFIRNGVNILDNPIKALSREEYMKFFKKYNIPGSSIRLLTVSRLESWKKVSRSIYALDELRRVDKKNNYFLLIVGDGSDRKNLENITRSLKLEQNVVFIGGVPNSEVCKYMQFSDIFLSFYDLSNVGNPLLEAICLGKPIVTYNIGDTSTVIDNKNGVILDDVCPQTIATAIKKMVYEKKFDYYSNNALKYAKENLYSWTRRMEIEEKEVLKLYER